jgi:hypothetical protein
MSAWRYGIKKAMDTHEHAGLGTGLLELKNLENFK